MYTYINNYVYIYIEITFTYIYTHTKRNILTCFIRKTTAQKSQKQGSLSHLAGFLQFIAQIAPKRDLPFTIYEVYELCIFEIM